MPRISAFYGIVIAMYCEEAGRHHAAHFHAFYGEQEASIGIESLPGPRWLAPSPGARARVE